MQHLQRNIYKYVNHNQTAINMHPYNLSANKQMFTKFELTHLLYLSAAVRRELRVSPKAHGTSRLSNKRCMFSWLESHFQSKRNAVRRARTLRNKC